MPVSRGLLRASAGGGFAIPVIPASQTYLSATQQVAYTNASNLYAARMNTATGAPEASWSEPSATRSTFKYAARWATGAAFIAYTLQGPRLAIAARAPVGGLVLSSNVAMYGQGRSEPGAIAISPNNRMVATTDSSSGMQIFLTDVETGVIAGGAAKSLVYLPSAHATAAWAPSSDALLVCGAAGTSFVNFYYFSDAFGSAPISSGTVNVPSSVYFTRAVWTSPTTGFAAASTAVHPFTRSGTTVTISATPAITGLGTSNISAMQLSADGTLLLVATGSSQALNVLTVAGAALTMRANAVLGVGANSAGLSVDKNYLYAQKGVYVGTDQYGGTTYRQALFRYSLSGTTIGSETEIETNVNVYINGVSVAP